MKQLKIYTDGSCLPKVSRGGWAFLVLENNKDIVHQENGTDKIDESDTTSQRMELIAALMGLRYVSTTYVGLQKEIIVCSDSAYLVNCFKDNWIDKWLRNGWRNYQGQPIVNRDLWEKLLTLTNQLNASYQFVKRNTDRYNVFVDKLSKSGRKESVNQLFLQS